LSNGFEQPQRSYELFVRYVLPKFDQRDASLGWMWENRHDFMAAKKKPSAAE
jgi:hypothetical protein